MHYITAQGALNIDFVSNTLYLQLSAFVRLTAESVSVDFALGNLALAQ